jgi:Tol biopolymer transport system component
MVMLRKLPLLVAGLLLQTTVSHAQSASLVRSLSDSDSMSVAYVTMSPDEKWLVFTQYAPGVGMAPTSGVSRLMIRPLSGGPLRELSIARGFNDRARFTPAGDRLVFHQLYQNATRLTSRSTW